MNGTTLLEALLAIAFGGLIASYTHIQVGKMIERRVLYGTATSLETLLQGSHEASQYHGIPFSLIKNVHGDFQVTNAQSQFYTLPLNTKQISQYSVHSSIRNSDSIQFHPDGYTSPGRIELHSRNFSCILRISMRGRVRKECSVK